MWLVKKNSFSKFTHQAKFFDQSNACTLSFCFLDNRHSDANLVLTMKAPISVTWFDFRFKSIVIKADCTTLVKKVTFWETLWIESPYFYLGVKSLAEYFAKFTLTGFAINVYLCLIYDKALFIFVLCIALE